MTKYECPNCEHVCTEDDMEADWMYYYDEDDYADEVWCNHVCPSCHSWQNLNEWIVVGESL